MHTLTKRVTLVINSRLMW